MGEHSPSGISDSALPAWACDVALKDLSWGGAVVYCRATTKQDAAEKVAACPKCGYKTLRNGSWL